MTVEKAGIEQDGRSAAPRRKQGPRLAPDELEALIDAAIVDAYGESEQAVGFLTMLEEHLALPFNTEVLGVEVTVEKLDLTDRDDIVALCKRGRHRQALPLQELPLSRPPPAGWEWIEAYRRWARGSR
jgi:hypothetical protein